MEKDFYSTNEVAKIVGLSRQAICKRIKAGTIKANKVGKNLIIRRAELPKILNQIVSDSSKNQISVTVKRLVDEYGEILKLLDKE
ncbi:helix-turn-helix domain-containing protein [bacterium]|nr:helix-turn-helix domain-containing protein [bacterium]